MKLLYLDVDEFAKDLKDVTSAKIYESGKFAKDGIFSQQIFGPIKSYSCPLKKPTCNTSKSREGEICKVCNVEITTSSKRRKTFAKIDLPFEILNPIIYFVLCSNRTKLKKTITDMLSYKESYYIEDDVLKLYNEGITDIDKSELLIGMDGVTKFLDFYFDKNKERSDVKYIQATFNKYTIKNILVIPPEFRPVNKDSNGLIIQDEINQYYTRLIMKTQNFKGLPFEPATKDPIYRTNFWSIQTSSFELYDFILKKMSKKQGILRSNILGKRVDFSSRAVITPEPELNLGECGLPYIMLLEMFKPQFTRYLINTKVFSRYNQAVMSVDDCIKKNDKKLLPYLKEFVENKVCVLNRQPSLHRLSMLGFNIKLSVDNTIKLHPLICPAFNADHDGDTMAVYIPLNEKSEMEIRNKIHIKNNLLSPANLSSVPEPNQDVILGIYMATKNEEEEKEEFKGELVTKSRKMFNECLPEKYPLINKVVTKSELKRIFNDLALRFPYKVAMESFDKIKTLGFYLSTIHGYTLGLDDLYSKKLNKLNKKLTGEIEKDIATIKNSEDVNNELKSLRINDYIESGARGSWDQAKQLVYSRGYVADANNNVRDYLIRSNLTKGLSPREFFESSWGSRKGLLDTALSTGDSGYLTRQLIYSTIFSELDEELEDCTTNDYLNMNFTIKNSDGTINQKKSLDFVKLFLWRYYLDEETKTLKMISSKNFKDLVGKTVKIRSPIYCKSEKICKKCYGNLYKILHSNQIGVIGTQSVSERITQLVLRTFHISGVVSGKDESGKNDDIISGMTIANKLFHNPEKLGTINTPEDMVYLLYKIFGQYGNVHMIHYEVIVAAMMWRGEELWRLTKERDISEIEFVSVLKIPALTSWLLGAAFSNVKLKVLDGLIKEKVSENNSLTELFDL